MIYEIIDKDNGLELKGIKDFNLKHTFECGQCFRWTKESDDSYTIVAKGGAINLKQELDSISVVGANRESWLEFWHHYFDLDTDYSRIKETLQGDETLDKAMDFGWGMRILNQDPFETTISFMISANNQIPRIKASVDKISTDLGDKLELLGKEYYTFPLPKHLAYKPIEDIKDIYRVGFRSERIKEVARRVYEGEFSLDELWSMPYKEAKEKLLTLPGIGTKVADCILLFSYKKVEAFPVDVWVKRVMEHFYFKRQTPNKLIEKVGCDMFGDLAGFAQQYLFYYARENGLGKK